MTQYTVSTALQLKYEQYVGGAKKATAATKEMSDAATKARKEHDLLGNVATGVAVLYSAQFAKKIISSASDLNETMSKVNVVFGKNADSVIAWSKTSASAMGLSQQKAAEAAATYGNLFTAMGIGTGTSEKMSTQLVQLAGDLASFNNVDPAAALDALRSGLVGETEPLRQFGVNLNDADLRQKAMQLGLVKTTKEVLPAAARAQAAYALILEQTTTAQGDFARTSSGLANQQRILNAEWENAQAGLGKALVGPAQNAVGALNDLLSVFNALPEPVQQSATYLGILSAGFLLLAPRLAQAKAMLEAWPAAAKVAGVAAKGLGVAMGALAVAAVVADFIKVNDQLRELDANIRKMASSRVSTQNIDDLRTSYVQLMHDIDSPGIMRVWRDGFNVLTGQATELDRMQSAAQTAGAAYAKLTEASGNAAFALGTTGTRAMQLASDAGVDLSGSTSDITKAIIAYAKSQSSGSVASHTASTALGVLGDSTSTVTDRLKALKDQFDATIGGMLSTSDATIAAERALDDMSKSIKDNGNVWKTSTEQGRANQSQLNDSIRSFEAVRESMIEQGSSVHHADAVMAGYLTQLRDRLPAGAKTARAEVQQLINKFNSVPAKKSTTFTANTAPAMTAVEALRAYYKAHPVSVDVRARYLGTGYSGTGGTTFAPTSPFKKKAGGGQIDGPGSGTSDDVPIWASKGEWVVRSSSASHYGPARMARINAGTAVVDGYATGGKVKKRTVSTRVAGHVGRRAFDFGDRSQIADASNVPLLGSFDFTAYGQAVQRATSATQALFDARVKVNEASTPQEEAQAQRDLAAATLEVANAEKAKAAAKPTAGNIEATFSRRAQKLDRFRRNLRTLAQRGLSSVILKEILDAGIDSGYDMAAAIVGDPTMIPSLNRTQAAITSDANAIAAMFGGADRASTVSSLGGGSSSGSVSSSASSGVQTVKVQLEMTVKGKSGEAVWHDVLTYGRGRGGNLPTLGPFTIKLK